MKSFAMGCALAASAWIGAAAAQSLTVEEIRARVDQNLRDLSAYHELLADPDPARSSAAMKVMLESGDVDLQRIALDYGLYSPNPAVKRKALEGFFASEPRVEVFVDGKGIQSRDAQNNLANAVGQYGGSLAGGDQAYFTWKLGKADLEQNCMLDSAGKDCAVRITDSGVSVRPWGAWFLLTPDEEGNLVGTVPIANAGRFPLRIPIRR